MKISEKQLADIAQNGAIQLIKRSKLFLKSNFKEWSAKRQEPELEQFIETLIKYANQFSIFKEINLQKLMMLEIKYGLMHSNDGTDVLKQILNFDERPEDLKINYLHKQLIHYNANFVGKD